LLRNNRNKFTVFRGSDAGEKIGVCQVGLRQDERKQLQIPAVHKFRENFTEKLSFDPEYDGIILVLLIVYRVLNALGRFHKQ
jgi:hypothetical protein